MNDNKRKLLITKDSLPPIGFEYQFTKDEIEFSDDVEPILKRLLQAIIFEHEQKNKKIEPLDKRFEISFKELVRGSYVKG